MGGMSPLTSSSRWRLNQSTQCSLAASMCSTVRQGPRRRISSVLNNPIIDSASALSSASPTLPTDASTPAAARRSVNAIEVYLAAGVVVVHQAAQVGDTVAGAGPDRLLDGVQHQVGAHGPRHAPAQDAAGVGVDHERDVDPSPTRSTRRHLTRVGCQAAACFGVGEAGQAVASL